MTCGAPAALSLTLSQAGNTLQLRAADRNRVPITFQDLKRPPRFEPCTDLKRARARVVYFADPDRPDSGEVLAIELSK